VLDYLIGQQRIQPVIAVFVPPVNRTEEYAGRLKSRFTSFIIDEVLTWLDAAYRTRRSPASRATLGASNGGNIALWIGLTHPDVFGNVAAQSSNVESAVSEGFARQPHLNLKIYLDLGTYDMPEVIPLVRNLKTIIAAKGRDLVYQEFHEGHSWGN